MPVSRRRGAGSPTSRENKLNLKKRTKVGKNLSKSLFTKTEHVDVEDPLNIQEQNENCRKLDPKC